MLRLIYIVTHGYKIAIKMQLGSSRWHDDSAQCFNGWHCVALPEL